MGAPSDVDRIDHLLFAALDLDRGIDEIARRLGARPAVGGRHPRYGTRNALLSLGPATYLEVIAPDPGLPEPERGPLFDFSRGAGRLATWVLRSEAVDELADRARAAGVDLGEVAAGHRQQPDGTTLTWRLSDPYAERLGGAVPFLISWGDTPHPAAAAPRGGELVGLRIEHPAPRRVRPALAALGIEIEVERADAFSLVATIRTADGDVELW